MPERDTDQTVAAALEDLRSQQPRILQRGQALPEHPHKEQPKPAYLGENVTERAEIAAHFMDPASVARDSPGRARGRAPAHPAGHS